jgi:hypothetical protein
MSHLRLLGGDPCKALLEESGMMSFLLLQLSNLVIGQGSGYALG